MKFGRVGGGGVLVRWSLWLFLRRVGCLIVRPLGKRELGPSSLIPALAMVCHYIHFLARLFNLAMPADVGR